MRRASILWGGISWWLCGSCTVETFDAAPDAFSQGGSATISKGGFAGKTMTIAGGDPLDNQCARAFDAADSSGSGGSTAGSAGVADGMAGAPGAAGAPSAPPQTNPPLGCPATEPSLRKPCDWALVVCNYGDCVTSPLHTYVCCAGQWKGLANRCD